MLMHTDRASFMGRLSHITERRRLEIILDPAASGPAFTRNKRIQVSPEEFQNPEPGPLNANLTANKRPGMASKRPRKVTESESEEDIKSPPKGKKKDKKSQSRKGKSGSKSSGTKPNTSSYGAVSEKGGKCPKSFSGGKHGGSDSDVSHQVQQIDKESHSDSLTDS